MNLKPLLLFCLAGLVASTLTPSASAQTRTLRIVAQNLGADINGITMPQPGLIAPPNDTNNYAAGGELEGMGEEIVTNDPAQAIDILALEETTSNPTTVAPIANGLNTFYGLPGMYSNSSYQATESGGDVADGNGPNAIVFNTRTVRLLASVPVDPPGGTGNLGKASGEYREVVRYEFAPAGVATNATNVFFIYVSHYKSSSSGTLSTNQFYRNEEAQIIRNNSATLPANARILLVGDFNTGDASEPMYSTLIGSGINQAIDPLNPAGNTSLDWDINSTSVLPAKSFSPTAIHYRDDYEMMTTNVYYGIDGGLKFVPGSYHVFGNNGSIGYLGNVNSGANTALNNRLATNGPVFIPAAQIYTDLASASDHLPVTADYTIPMPVPQITSCSLSGNDLMLSFTNGITNAVYSLLMQTNLATPLINWTSLVNYTATSGAFSFTATNAVDATTPQRFYRLKGK